MKVLTATAIAEIAKAHGTQPFIIVEIQWAEDAVRFYATRQINDIPGKVLTVGQVESIATGDNRSSQSLSLTFDDTDGEIKEIINVVDVHKVTCKVYQHYLDLAESHKFLLLQGQISTPYTWGEGDRTVQFDVLSEIESFEVGFSPEEGQLDFVSQDFIGKPWPLCFGSVIHVPAQKVHQTLTGILLEDIGIVDPALQWKIDRLTLQFKEALFLLKLQRQIMVHANEIAPPVKELLPEYIALILEERALLFRVNQLLTLIDRLKRDIVKKPDNRALKDGLVLFEADMVPLANAANLLYNLKLFKESQIDLALYEHNVKEQAANEVINQINKLTIIKAEILKIQQEICRQAKLVKDCFLVQNGELFPQGVQTEIVVNNLKFRGIFTGNQFCISVGPYAKYKNILVDNWQIDDDPCQPEDENNGLATFYLKDTPPVNLVGLYLLVKARGSEARHIIKVQRQDGVKVIFELVEWDRANGQPSGISIDEMVGKVKRIPENGEVDVELLLRPETAKLQAIIANIPGGVNARELEYLSKLVFLEPSDSLMDVLLIDTPTARDLFTIIGEDVLEIQEAAGVVLESWLRDYIIPYEEIPDTLEWRAETGTNIRTVEDDCEIYIANILPSEIHAVYAYRTVKDGKRILAQVPSTYYTKNENQNLGTIDITCLIFKVPLREIAGENWEDDVYVTLTSTVGPNVADIIEHLITTYTVGGTVNTANFDSIRDKFRDGSDEELYPANFALFDRPNVLDEIARIAWEARCGLYRVGNEYFLRYLSEEPDEDFTFTLADIESESLSLVHTATENLTTRLIAKYDLNYLPIEDGKKQPELVYRHNIKKYGLHASEEHFHIYNIPELVEKSATFWLIRQANTWKRVTFRTVLKNIRMDLFDCVLFNISQTFFADAPVKGIVENCTYDPSDHSIVVEAWLPIRSGEMSEYYWAWPSQKDETAQFPTNAEIEKGYGGGYGPGTGVTGTIPGC